MTGDVDEEVGTTRTPWIGEMGRRGGIAIAKTRCPVISSRRMGFHLRKLCDYLGGDVGELVGDFRIREEQRELQGPKSKSGGTEIVMSPKTNFTKWECPGDGWEV
jgi:hypothetical protein